MLHRKILLPLIFTIASFFFIGNANASTLIDNFDFTVYNSDFTFPYKTEELGTYEDNYNRAYQYYLDNCQGVYDSYIIDKTGYGYGWGDNQVNLLCFNQSDNAWSPSVEMYYNQDSSIWLNYRIEIFKPNNNNYITQHFYNTTSTISYNYNQIYFDLYNYEKLNNKTLSKESGIIDTNIKFYFNSNQYSKGTYAINSFIYEGQTYTVGDLIYESGSFAGSKPTISFSTKDYAVTIDDTYYVTSVDLDINFSSIDNDKYMYRYIKGNDESYTTLTLSQGTSYTVNFAENDSIKVEILNLETKDLVTSSTFTVSSISEYVNSDETIDISFKFVTKDINEYLYNSSVLYVPFKQKYYQLSKYYYIYFSKVDFTNYTYEYSIDNGVTWKNCHDDLIYNNSYFIHYFLKNGDSIIVRVINVEDESINNIKSFTVSGIESIDDEEVGQQVIFTPSYDLKSPIIYVDLGFINYDSSLYNYYYQVYTDEESESNLIDITNDINCDTDLPYCYYEDIKVFNKGSIKVVITDKNDEQVANFTFTVDYYKHIDELNRDSKKTFLDSLRESLSYFTKPIGEIFKHITLFFNSMPMPLQYTFIACFIILIALYLFKFII